MCRDKMETINHKVLISFTLSLLTFIDKSLQNNNKQPADSENTKYVKP